MSNPKVTNVHLTTKEIEFLLEELEGDFADQEAADLAEQITLRLINQRESAIATNMWYVNYYEIEQSYGGPEEGGWWYYTEQCVDSVGYSVDVSSRDDVSILHEKVLGYFDEDQYDRVPSIEEIQESLNSYGHITIVDHESMTRYGEGMVVKIERAPAQSEDIRRQHYE